MRLLTIAIGLSVATSACARMHSSNLKQNATTFPRVVVIDLAVLAPGTYSIPRGQPAIDTVRIADLVPSKNYDISFDHAPRVQSVLPNPQPAATPAKPSNPAVKIFVEMPTVAAGSPPCTNTFKALADLDTKATEADVAKQIDVLHASAQAELTAGTCTDAELLSVGKEVNRLTTRSFAIDNVRANEDLTLTVTRAGDAAGTALTWKNNYAGRDDGDWRVLYGFLFAPDAWPAYTYYTSATTDSKFEIQHRRVRNPISLIPSAQYLFHEALPGTAFCRCTPTAGLGFDLTSPTVHIGFAWVYHENIALSLGGVVHQVRDLNDKYSLNQVLATDLDNNQLTQMAFHANPFIAVSFRFGSSPFSTPPTTGSNGK